MNVNASKFRKKPVVIEAHQLPVPPADGSTNEVYENAVWAFLSWCSKVGFEPVSGPADGSVTIDTLEGVHTASPGDWIIKGVKGEFYPCKPDIFAATYESADIDLDAADFSDALMWLKEGKRVQRAGWNGSNQWVELVKNSGLIFRSEHDNTAFSVADGLVLKNAQGIVVQWVPSIGDLMAEDWKVVGKNVDEPSYRTVSSDGRETLNFVSNTLPHQRRVIEEYDQLFNRHQDLTKFFDTDLYRSLSVEERNRLKEQSLFMAEYQRVLLERIRAF